MSRLTVVDPPAPSAIARFVTDFVQDKRAGGAAPKTVAQYSDVLEGVFLPYLASASINDVEGLTSGVLNGLSASLLDGEGSRSGRPLSKATVASYGRTVNVFLRWVEREADSTIKARAKLPARSKRVLDVLSRAEIQAMEDAAPTDRDKLIVRVLGDTGMRVGELLGLGAGDVRVEAKRHALKVRGKGDKERLVAIEPRLARRLQVYATKTRSPGPGPLFLGHRRRAGTGEYGPLTASGVDQLVRDVAVRARISRRVYPHLFRHSFVTNYLRQGGNPVLCAQIVGHTNLTMIHDVYQHLNFGDSADELMRILARD
jgi:integrase/recombinase XerD